MAYPIEIARALIKRNDVEGVLEWMDKHPQPAKDLAPTLMEIAVQSRAFHHGDAAIASLFLPHGCNIEIARSVQGYDVDESLFVYALKHGPVEFAEAVAAQKTFVLGREDLAVAIRQRRDSLVDTLLTKTPVIKKVSDEDFLVQMRNLHFGIFLKGDKADAAEYLRGKGAQFTSVNQGIDCVKSSSRRLLMDWIETFKQTDGYGRVWPEALFEAAKKERLSYVELLLHNMPEGRIQSEHFFSEDLTRILVGNNYNPIALPLIEKGLLGVGDEERADINAIKCLVLGKPYKPENVALFDRLTAHLFTECEKHKDDKDGQVKGDYRYLKKRLQEIHSGAAEAVEYVDNDDVARKTKRFYDFLAFAKVIGLSHQLAEGLDPAHQQTVSPIFTQTLLQSQGNWSAVYKGIHDHRDAHGGRKKDGNGQQLASECAGVQDCVDYLIKVLVVPEVLRRAKRQCPNVLIDFTEVTNCLRPLMAQAVVGKRSLANVLSVSQAWHTKLNYLELMRVVPQDAVWPELTREYTAPNGYTVRFLTTPDQLRENAGRLHHCGGTKTADCVYHNKHMASIERNGEPVATAMLHFESGMSTPVFDAADAAIKDDLRIPQDSEAWHALQAFIRAFERREFTVNEKKVAEAHVKAMERYRGQNLTKLKEWIGFDPLAIPPQAKTVEIWEERGAKKEIGYENIEEGYFTELLGIQAKEVPLLARGKRHWVHDAQVDRGARNPYLQNFLKETGLDAAIDEIVKDPPILPAQPTEHSPKAKPSRVAGKGTFQR